VKAIGKLDIGCEFHQLQLAFMLEICGISKMCLLHDLQIGRFPVGRRRRWVSQESDIARIGLALPYMVKGTVPATRVTP
jgi:hypothetical protein